jgi:PAS domain S-box-containing protein
MTGIRTRRPGTHGGPGRDAERRAILALQHDAGEQAGVLLLGMEAVGDRPWHVLTGAGLGLVRVADVPDAVRDLTERAAQVVIADADNGPALTRAVRSRPDLAGAHIVVCAALESPHELRAALDAGADDVMRLPFEPEVLAARVGAGLRAARLRANEALLRSLVANIPGALYRCVCDGHWTMLWLSDEIERIAGYPASDFIGSAVRTFASIIHPDDREQVERSVGDGVAAGRPFTIEYRIIRCDGGVRWVLERGQAQVADDGRRWLDGAIFDVTARRAAEQALHQREIAEAQLAEVQASRARIVDAADRARREIERNLHDGAQQRLVSVALRLQVWLASDRHLPADARAEVADVLAETRACLAELRDLARGLHPAVLSDHGLEAALRALAGRSAVSVELRVHLPGERLPASVESAAYFIVCEALANVAKHAQATHAWITAEQRNRHLDVEIGDDGIGGVDPGSGSGLQGLRDRVAALDGTLSVRSRARNGTVVRARLPLRHPNRAGVAGTMPRGPQRPGPS